MKAFAAAALAVCAVVPAFAATPVTLDFEGVNGYATSISNFYNGGSDTPVDSRDLADAGAVNLGIAFSSSALATTNDANFTYFSGAPAGSTAMFVADANAVMNIAGGIQNGLSFAYSSASNAAGNVQVFSGLGGTGALLGSVDLLATNGACDPVAVAYCAFSAASVQFSGVAHSVTFGATSQDAYFDNVAVTLAVPEPSSWALCGIGLAGLLLMRRRLGSV